MSLMNIDFRLLLVLALLCCLASAADREHPTVSSKAPPLSAEESIRTMQIQPGYNIVPVLTEPHIHEPAALAWDGNGRLYVVEMRTYMQEIDGKNQLAPTSRVSRHEDTDGDGIYDKHTVFADGLSLPRMILPLLDRVIICETNTLDLKSYQDTDEDGVADRVEIWHEGGPRGGNLEHQPSGLIWNIDNWIYTTYSRHRYRFTNGQVQVEPLPHGAGQWGLTHDDVGRIFYSSAGGENPATDFQQPIIYGQLSLPGEQAPGFRSVFPIDSIPDTQGGRGRLRADNTLNHFSASCGQSIYRGDRLPAEFSGDLIICEPVGRLIRRAKVVNDQGRIVVSNAYPETEFIRATDPNFRPINSATGPDGCLYLVDMYRGIIQEGNWVREGSYLREVVQEYELDRNIGRGRIYRVEHTTTRRGPMPRMLEETPAELVAHLSHPNGWWRSEAQKLLVLHGDKSVVPALKKLARAGETPLSRLHALWTLEGLDACDNDVLREAMRDSDPRSRAAAIRIAEPQYEHNRNFDSLLRTLANDDQADVVIQVLLSTSRGEHPAADDFMKSIVAEHEDQLAIREIANQYRERRAAILAEKRRLEELRRRNRLLAESVVRGKAIYTTLCINCHGPDGQGKLAPGKENARLAPPLAGSARVRGHKERLTRILLHGLIGPVDDQTYSGGLMLPMGSNTDQWIADVATYIRNNWGNQAPLIEEDDVRQIRASSADRRGPWTLLELARYDPPAFENRDAWKLTASHRTDKLPAAVDGNPGSRWDTSTTQKPGMWFGIEFPEPVQVSSIVLDTRGSNADYPRGYFVQLSDDGVTWSEPQARGRGFDPVTEIELREQDRIRHIRITQTGQSNSKFWSIHELTVKGLTGNEPEPVLLAEELTKVDSSALAAEARKTGSPLRGASLFYRSTLSCAKCHDPGQGPRLGPDLASHRDGVSNSFLVESILDPSRKIRKGFEQVIVETEDGLVVTGFRVTEDKETLTIREPGGGQEIKLAQTDIVDVFPSQVSAMPPGLVNQLQNRQQFFDLVSFVFALHEGGPTRLAELKAELSGEGD